MTSSPVLPWIDYAYCVSSNGGTPIATGIAFSRPLSRDDVEERILNQAAHLAVTLGIPWNPFNVELVFRPVL